MLCQRLITGVAIRHPFVAAGALICIYANPDILLTPLRLTGRTSLWPFKLSWRFALYIFGFRGHGVAKDSLASRYQSHRYGGYVPRDSTFARFQSYGATEHYDISEARRFADDNPEAMRLVLDDLEALRSAHADDENRDFELRSMLADGVSWLSAIGALFVLGRRGW
ncbi:hypothetical protein BDR03DRAFT_156008 [Suillus americanus]|nr:hypothetical protein BDR03DRAFT_156008 [Suillus americanus]